MNLKSTDYQGFVREEKKKASFESEKAEIIGCLWQGGTGSRKPLLLGRGFFLVSLLRAEAAEPPR